MDGYNIYLRQDGRWEGRISQGKKENGKRKFLYIFGKSREAVRNKIDELRKNSNRALQKQSMNFLVSGIKVYAIGLRSQPLQIIVRRH